MVHALPALAAAASAVAATPGLGWMLRPVVTGYRIRAERPSDAGPREALLDASFGVGRFAKTSERLRERRLAAEGLSFSAVAGDRLVGTLRFWHVEAGREPVLLLGPLAVDPTLRSAGIGRALMEHGLKRARALGHGAVILVGDAPYYARFGFAQISAQRIRMPGPVDPTRLLGADLVPGTLARAEGRVVGTGLIVGERRSEEPLRRAA